MDGSLTLRDRRNMAAGVSNTYLQALLDKAAESFRDGDYQRSLHFLNNAIEDDAEAPIAVIDKRAATFLKLADFDRALSDAGAIIRRDQTNVIGYLRLGQILQFQRRPEKALKIYERGLRMVSSHDSHYKRLKHSYNSLVTVMAPRGSIDPLTQFPQEIINMIFDHLAFPDIVTSTRVCKFWYQAVTSQASLWTVLDFSGARKGYSLDTIRSYVKRSNGETKRFVTSGLGQEHRALFYVAQHCKKLQELHYVPSPAGSSLYKAVRAIKGLRKLTLSSSCEISLDLCVDILRSCERLEDVEFLAIDKFIVHGNLSDLPELENLRMITLNGSSQGQHQRALDILPQLKHVHVLNMTGWVFDGDYLHEHGFVEFENLTRLNITGSCRALLPAFAPSIIDLSINVTRAERSRTERIQKLPNLVRLSLVDSAISQSCFSLLCSWLSQNKGNLLELRLDGHVLSTPELQRLVKEGFLDSAEILSLRQSDFTDEVAESVAKSLHKLKALDIAHTLITGVAVKAVITGVGSILQSICLDSCRCVSIDAVEWARARGVHVSFKFPENSSGRKIRSA